MGLWQIACKNDSNVLLIPASTPFDRFPHQEVESISPPLEFGLDLGLALPREDSRRFYTLLLSLLDPC